jgi:hypothetical protein
MTRSRFIKQRDCHNSFVSRRMFSTSTILFIYCCIKFIAFIHGDPYNEKLPELYLGPMVKFTDKDEIFKTLVTKQNQASLVIFEIISILRDILEPYVTRVYINRVLVCSCGTISQWGFRRDGSHRILMFTWGQEMLVSQNNATDIFKT